VNKFTRALYSAKVINITFTLFNNLEMQKLGRKEGVPGVVAWRRRWWWWRAWGCWLNEHFLLCLCLVFFLWLSVRRPPCVSLFSPSLFCLSFVFFFSLVSLCLRFFFLLLVWPFIGPQQMVVLQLNYRYDSLNKFKM